MKALIWFLTVFFGYAVPYSILKGYGITFGWLLTIVAWVLPVTLHADYFCKLYDDRLARKKRAIMTEAAKREGMTFEEYALKDAPSNFIEI